MVLNSCFHRSQRHRPVHHMMLSFISRILIHVDMHNDKVTFEGLNNPPPSPWHYSVVTDLCPTSYFESAVCFPVWWCAECWQPLQQVFCLNEWKEGVEGRMQLAGWGELLVERKKAVEIPKYLLFTVYIYLFVTYTKSTYCIQMFTTNTCSSFM